MQTLEYRRTQPKEFQLTLSLAFVLGCIMLWVLPASNEFCKQIDAQAFNYLNKSLLQSHSWQLFWGYLNHPNETWLNLILMGGINILAVTCLPKYKRTSAIAKLIYFWIFFQFVLLFTHQLFANWLHIERDSPSLVLHTWVLLSDNLNMNLKVASCHCFPAGHALVLVFWAGFTSLYAPRWFRPVLWFVAILFSLPRLFSGAHWLSDIVFTAGYAWLWFNLAISTPVYSFSTNKIEILILNLQQRTRKIAGTI